ncbi:MAG: glycosyltransferase family 2 protein [Clostridiales bacterium]|jgi:glycosyltransferase involved in cell wall biosynthesis|nr:glycosyltransferase family 2 protein [Clostridiales bacterium]
MAKADKAGRPVDLIVPCFNESAMLRLFHGEAEKAAGELPGYTFRYIFVDDGSTDGTLGIMQDLARESGRVSYISFSRNFGKEAGIYAGLRHSTAPLAVIIDADLQHPPSMIRDMIGAIDGEGYDSCSARRISREGEPMIRSAFARGFYRLINKMADIDIVDGAVDFRMMTSQMVAAILELSEVQRFSKGIFSWVGFRTKWIEYKNVERLAGESKWSFMKLAKYALGGITSFTTVPLRFAFFAGLVFSMLSFALLAYELAKTVIFGIGVPGYPSTLIMLLMIGGVIILSTGILGEYVARMYMETKRRPIYIEKCSQLRGAGGGESGGRAAGGRACGNGGAGGAGNGRGLGDSGKECRACAAAGSGLGDGGPGAAGRRRRARGRARPARWQKRPRRGQPARGQIK